jgi:hypothetical protein
MLNMKLKKQANGKREVILSQKEWEDIGKKAGWIKEAYAGDEFEYKGFKIELEYDEEIDNRKAVWYVYPPGQKTPLVANVSPYRSTIEDVEKWIDENL